MTEADAAVLVEMLASIIPKYVAKELGTVLVDLAATQSQCCLLDAQCRELGDQLAAMQAKPFVRFRGVWERGAAYAIGDAVTDHSSLWICTAATNGRPNEDHVGWQLAVKRGAAV